MSEFVLENCGSNYFFGLAIRGCRFIGSPPRRRSTRYELHGTFVLPIVFDGRAMNFEALRRPLATLHLQLTAGLFLGGGAAFGAIAALPWT
jgi:hypothetical protein